MPYAKFLKIHYKSVKEMPGDEADGCEPDVSPFEIATQSWQTFDMVYKQTKDRAVARRARPRRTTGRRLRTEKHDRPELEDHASLDHRQNQIPTANRQAHHQALRIRNPEGAWPYPFDKKAKTADFISYNAVLALAVAGRRPETDEHLAVP